MNKERIIMGQKLKYGEKAGLKSFPGEDITYTPPETIHYNPNVFLSSQLSYDYNSDKMITNNDKFYKNNNSYNKLKDIYNLKLLNENLNKDSIYMDKIKINDKLIDDAAKKYKKLRAIIASNLPLSDNLLGEESLPGPDTTFTPIPTITNSMVNLGCLNSTTVTDIVPVVFKWPDTQVPGSFTSGASGPLYASENDSGITGAIGTLPLTGINGPIGQPRTGNTVGRAEGSFTQFEQGDDLITTENTPDTTFQSTVGLISDISIYNISAVASGYGNISLAQEGVLWTLWPLTKQKGNYMSSNMSYFDAMNFGTAKSSRYPIGQMGFFINNILLGCTPFGTTNPNSGINPGSNTININDNSVNNNPGLSSYSPGILPGIEGLNDTLLTTTEQQVAICVVKVSEQVARIFNPSSGISSDERYIYVGYDAWSVVLTSANPLAPMAMQTYISPQSVSGSVSENNYQVQLPTNIINGIYYKNIKRNVPNSAFQGLFAGTVF